MTPDPWFTIGPAIIVVWVLGLYAVTLLVTCYAAARTGSPSPRRERWLLTWGWTGRLFVMALLGAAIWYVGTYHRDAGRGWCSWQVDGGRIAARQCRVP